MTSVAPAIPTCLAQSVTCLASAAERVRSVISPPVHASPSRLTTSLRIRFNDYDSKMLLDVNPDVRVRRRFRGHVTSFSHRVRLQLENLPRTSGFRRQVATIVFELKLARLEQVVAVIGDAALLETPQHTLDSIINKEQIDDLPAVDRDFSSLALPAPGVTTGSAATVRRSHSAANAATPTASSPMALRTSGSTMGNRHPRSRRMGFKSST